MAKTASRLTTAIDTVLVPGELLATTGTGWAVQRRGRIPLLFLGRDRYWFVLTDRRLLVFNHRRGGPQRDDLVLGKRYEFFTLEKVHRHRLLFQLRARGTNGSRLVMEFRPGQRKLAAELTARLRRALPAPGASTDAATPTPTATGATAADTPPSPSPPSPASPTPDAPRDTDAETAAAFWGEH